MNCKIVHIEDVGPVKIVKNPRSRRINLSIKPFEGVRLSIPGRVSYDKAFDVLQEKIPWIIKNLPKVKEMEKKKTVYSDSNPFRTRDHVLQLCVWQKSNVSVTISQNKILIKYPETMQIEDVAVQDAAREGIIRALRKEAKRYLPARVQEYSKKFNFKYNEVFVKNMKTRWGSCSGKNNINLNIQLMRLPEELMDYVIVHELCHTVQKNHSKKFWDLLIKCMPNAKEIDKKLNSYHSSIY